MITEKVILALEEADSDDYATVIQPEVNEAIRRIEAMPVVSEPLVFQDPAKVALE